MIYALALLWTNREFAAGLGSDSLVFTLMPWYIVIALGLGFGYAMWLRSATRRPTTRSGAPPSRRRTSAAE